MDRTQFKQRMKSLKSYREQNPGKGYWDWKAQAFEEGGETNWKFTEQDIVNSPYDDPSFVGKSYKGLHSILGKEAKDYIGNLNYLKSLSKFIRVFGPIADFVNYAFPQKESEYLYDTDKHFRDIVKKDKIQQVEMLEYGGETESKYPQFINGQRVNRWTGQPIATGQATPVLDLRTAADFTPVGDALAVNDAYQAIKNRDWLGAGLSALAVVPFIPTVNKRYVQDAIDRVFSRNTKNIQKATDLNNETYEVIQRLTDDPSYMNRANRVKEKYGDDYTQIYADLIDAYNTNPELLPKATPTEFSNGTNGRMSTTRKSTERHKQGGEFPKLGEYEYQFARDTDLPEGITVHETNHLSDFLKNKTSDADGNSNLFYQMRQSIKPYADGNNKYYGNMSEQKAYMNQLREYMYNRGLINNRDQQVDKELLQSTIDKLPSDMNSVKRASKQFKSMRQYAKWFNTIPLLGAVAVAANRYYTQQENK